MSDQTTSGEPIQAPATAPDAAIPAAPVSNPAPIGSFGNARGSGLARGKRATPAAAAPAAPSASTSGYQPTSVAVITPKREYTHPFASEQPASVPANEPAAPVASAPVEPAPAAPVPNTDIPVANAPVTGASEPPASTAPAAGEPVTPPAEVIQPSVEKAEIKILPPAEAIRPAVSWGEGSHSEETRPDPRDARPTFRTERERSEQRGERGEPRGDQRGGRGERGERGERRDPRAFEPRDSGKPQDPRFPRRDAALEQRGPLPHEAREGQRQSQATPAKSGGFLGWLKGLFGGKPETPAPSGGGSRDEQGREGDFRGGRRRHRGGRGRGGFQGDNRGPRDGQNRDQQPRPEGFPGGDQPQGDRRYEGGGGGRRRRRGGRGRFRDDRGGPNTEGQQGGGAI